MGVRSFNGGTSWTPASSVTLTLITANTYTYSLAVVNDAGCTVSYSPAMTVTVNQTPVISNFTASPDTLCSGESTLLEVTADGAHEYNFAGSWTEHSTYTGTPASVTVPTDTVYTVYVKSDKGCIAADSVTVTVNPLPVPVLRPSDTTVCAGDTIKFIASGGGSYCFTEICTNCVRNPYLSGNDEYGGGDCAILTVPCTYTEDSTYSLVALERGRVEVQVNVMNEYGCIDSTSSTVTVTPKGVARLLSAAPTDHQTRIFREPIDTIIYVIDNATSATVAGLPNGITYTCTNDTLIISGQTDSLGTYVYSITPTDYSCPVTTQGTLTIKPESFTFVQATADSVQFIANVRGGVFTVDWGDGSIEPSRPAGGNILYSHTYTNSSPHTVTVTAASLTTLSFPSYQHITALDVSKCRRLTYLSCVYQELATLNVSGCTALATLNCGNNRLNVLDVSNNTALTGLSCYSI